MSCRGGLIVGLHTDLRQRIYRRRRRPAGVALYQVIPLH
jgi:hypothetical protein